MRKSFGFSNTLVVCGLWELVEYIRSSWISSLLNQSNLKKRCLKKQDERNLGSNGGGIQVIHLLWISLFYYLDNATRAPYENAFLLPLAYVSWYMWIVKANSAKYSERACYQLIDHMEGEQIGDHISIGPGSAMKGSKLPWESHVCYIYILASCFQSQ